MPHPDKVHSSHGFLSGLTEEEEEEDVNMLNGFKVLYTNADSLINKLDELKSRLQLEKDGIDEYRHNRGNRSLPKKL